MSRSLAPSTSILRDAIDEATDFIADHRDEIKPAEYGCLLTLIALAECVLAIAERLEARPS